MRNVTFRGWDATGQKGWVYGDLVHAKGLDNSKPDFLYDRIMIGGYEVVSESVGECTGLKDKNGKEIFEGDIVECVSWNEYFSKDGQPMEPFRRKMYVDFRKGGFKMVEPMPEPMKDNEWDIICNGDIVIVGNIHDNLELIEKSV